MAGVAGGRRGRVDRRERGPDRAPPDAAPDDPQLAGHDDQEAVRKADADLSQQPSGGKRPIADNASTYGEGLYYVAFFGTPSTSRKWTVQFGGHHLAMHMTFSGETVSNTPYFIGVEPRGEFTVDGETYEPMADEAAALFGAVQSLTASQRTRAQLGQAFDDVLVGPQEDGQFPARQGIAGSFLSAAQQRLVTRAIRAYVGDMPAGRRGPASGPKHGSTGARRSPGRARPTARRTGPTRGSTGRGCGSRSPPRPVSCCRAPATTRSSAPSRRTTAPAAAAGAAASASAKGTTARDPEALGVFEWHTTALRVDGDGGSWLRGFTATAGLGVEHIAEGADHLLFLLMLLVPAPLVARGGRRRRGDDARRRVVRVVRVVTAFAIGHSITLALATLGAVELPSRLVESLIALSILVSAAHAARPLVPGGEAPIALGFGLVHRLAFATLLGDLGLGGGSLASSLLGFNLGIEIAHLLVVAVMMPSLYFLSPTAAYAPFAWPSPAPASCSLGWFLERAGLLGGDLFAPVSAALVEHPLVVAAAFALMAAVAHYLPTPSAAAEAVSR